MDALTIAVMAAHHPRLAMVYVEANEGVSSIIWCATCVSNPEYIKDQARFRVLTREEQKRFRIRTCRYCGAQLDKA